MSTGNQAEKDAVHEPLFAYTEQDAESVLERPLNPGEADRLRAALATALTDAAWSAVVTHETREADRA